MALGILRDREPEKVEFFRRAAAAEPENAAPSHKQVGNRTLLGDSQRVMEVETDDRGPQPNPAQLPGQVQSEQERRGQMPLMNVCVMLGKPGVVEAEPIGQLGLCDYFRINLSRRPLTRALHVIGDAESDHSTERYFQKPLQSTAIPTPHSAPPTPTPHSLLPTPYSLLPTPYSLLPTPTPHPTPGISSPYAGARRRAGTG